MREQRNLEEIKNIVKSLIWLSQGQLRTFLP